MLRNKQQTIQDELNPRVKWKSKKKYPCKRLKGEHNFIHKKTDIWRWSTHKGVSLWKTYECTACGKLDFKTEEIKEEK